MTFSHGVQSVEILPVVVGVSDGVVAHFARSVGGHDAAVGQHEALVVVVRAAMLVSML